MAQRPTLPAQQVQVAERGTFLDGHRTVAGYVARKGRTYAHVVTDEGTEVRVPYRLLARDLGTPRKQVQSRTDMLRAQWHAGDRVSFAVGPEVLHGTISRVNPRYAHVVCDDDREYRVPYGRLSPQEPRAATAPRARQRTDGDLQAIAVRATAWLAAHQAGVGTRAARASMSDSPRLFERSERSERSEFGGATLDRAPQRSRCAASTATA